jgi:hypothetical protein
MWSVATKIYVSWLHKYLQFGCINICSMVAKIYVVWLWKWQQTNMQYKKDPQNHDAKNEVLGRLTIICFFCCKYHLPKYGFHMTFV